MADFVEDLRTLMRSWNSPEARIEESLPRVIRACVRVGILVQIDDNGFEVTDSVQDADAWERVWEILEKEGIEGSHAS